MIGVRAGLKAGCRVGPALGVGADQMAQSGAGTWTVDPDSGIAWPSSAAEMSAFRSANALTAPSADFLWNCQDASGGAAAAYGGVNLAAAGTVSYANAVSGWSRTFLGTTDGTSGSFGSTAAGLPDPASSSWTLLVLAAVTATPAAQRSIVECFTSGNIRIRINTTPRMVVFDNANSTTGGSNPVGATAVRPYWLRYGLGSDTTALNDLERISCTHTDRTGKNLVVGGATSNPPAMRVGGIALWASALTNTQIKDWSTAMGFTIPWSP